MFHKLTTIGNPASNLSPDTIAEVAEIRQNYFQAYSFLMDVMPLVRTAAEDIYFGRQRLNYQVPSDLTRFNFTSDLVARFTRMLAEFGNPLVSPLLIASKLYDCDDRDLRYGQNGQVKIDRLMADEFKSLGHQEKPTEFKTIFSQLFMTLPSSKFVTIDEYAFRVTLKGEGAYDAGGPRREVISNICSELMSPVLSILVPTGNNLANYGEFT